MNVSIPNDFTPRDYQIPYMAYFDQGGKRAFCNWHRRGGKDLVALHQTCKMMHRRVGTYWHIFPSFAQGRKAIWEGFRRDGKRIMENVFPGFTDPRRPGSIVKRKDEQQMMVELKCGSIWRLIGSDNVEVVGAGPVGVVFSEFALAKPAGWQLISPMLRENGGWASFITTPRGKNHAYDLFQKAGPGSGWYRDVKTVRDTHLTYSSDVRQDVEIDHEEMMREELLSGIPQEVIDADYLCDWNAALVGSIYGDLLQALEARESSEGWKTPRRVYTAWDLGHGDGTAVWFFEVDPVTERVDVIDFYENQGKALDHYFKVIAERGYPYEIHFLPHDAGQVTLASGVSTFQLAAAEWPGKVKVLPKLPVQDGIQAVRRLLARSVRFHSRCEAGVAALKHYHRDYDRTTRTFSTQPVHDWSSHPADAFRYLVTGVKRIMAREVGSLQSQPAAEVSATVLPERQMFKTNLIELFEDRERQFSSRRIM